MRQGRIRRITELTTVLLLLTGCAALETTPTLTTAPSPTPDPCTGWTCTVSGVVYDEATGLGNELAVATVTLQQTSYCSPTRGQHQTTTSADGTFEFDGIFFHDTDRIQIQVAAEGYEPATWDSVDTYCFYCNCFTSPLEITLTNNVFANQ